MKKRAYEKNRRILYVVLSSLLILGAIGGVAARELTSKPYDAPDLYLTLGSETYDLLEGITYDSDSYDLVVKDDGGLNINQVGKYEVSYTLTPKGEETSSEEAETQSLEGEPSQQTETSEEAQAETVDETPATDETTVTGEADAAVQSEDANADTEAETQSVAEDGTEATTIQGGVSEPVTEETEDAAEATSEETITVTEITPMQSKDAEEAASQDDSSTEDTILFKRNVWVQSEEEDAKYLVAEPLQIETGSTDWDLFEGVELRDASGEPVAENVTLSLTEQAQEYLDQNTMTDNEVEEYIETMQENGEDPAAAHETATMSSKDDEKVTNPPLKEGAYLFDMEATDEETGETYQATRIVIARDVKENWNFTYRAGAYVNRVKSEWKEQQIDTLLFSTLDVPLGASSSSYYYLNSGALSTKNLVNVTHIGREDKLGGNKNNRVNWQFYTWNYEATGDVFEAALGSVTSYDFFTSKIHYYEVDWLGNADTADWYRWMGLANRGEMDYNGRWYYFTPHRGNNTDWNGCRSYPSWNWRATPYHINGDWNNLLGMLERTEPTLKEGGIADAIITDNRTGNINIETEYLYNDINEFWEVLPNAKNSDNSLTLEASPDGTVLQNAYNSAGINVPIQLEFKGYQFETSRNKNDNRIFTFNVLDNSFLRLNQLSAVSPAPAESENEGTKAADADANGELNSGEDAIKLNVANTADVEILGQDVKEQRDPQYIFEGNFNQGTITAGKYGIKNPMKINDFNALTIDTKGKSVYVSKIGADNENPTMESVLTITGGGSLMVNDTKDYTATTTESEYSKIVAKVLKVQDGDVIIPKVKNKDDDTKNRAEDKPALIVTEEMSTDGSRVVASTTDGNEPEDGEVFATTSAGHTLDPAMFKADDSWNDPSLKNPYIWIMDNKTTTLADGTIETDETKIVFKKVPSEIIYLYEDDSNVETGRYRTYEEAFKAIGNGEPNKVYKFENIIQAEFTQADAKYLAENKIQAKEFVFTSTNKQYKDIAPRFDYYHISIATDEIVFPKDVKKVRFEKLAILNTVKDAALVLNGGTIRFEESVISAGELPIGVYGGGKEDSAEDTTIEILGGSFGAVYGGNKEGIHSGNATITIDNTNKKVGSIKRVDGGDGAKQTKLDKKTAIISTKGDVTIQNIYNYDELTVEGGTLTVPTGAKKGANNVNAQETEGYKGKTILSGDATLKLLNNNGTRKMGSLAQKANTTGTPSLIIKKVSDADGDTASNAQNPYLLELTAKDPLNGVPKDGIKINYDDADTEQVGDIIVKMSGADETNLKIDPFKNEFQMTLIAEPMEKVLKLVKESVALIDSEGNAKVYYDIAGAVIGVSELEQQKAGQDYTISVFADDYVTSSLDYKAVEYAIGKEKGKFNYYGTNYDKVSAADTANQITWCSNLNKDNTELANPNTVYPKTNLGFFGKSNILTNIKLDYTGNKDSKNLYANGRSFTVDAGVEMVGTEYPNLYGAGETDVASTNITINKTEAKFATIYGGAVSDKVKVEKEKVINFPVDYEAINISDFDQLNVGTADATTILTVTGKIYGAPANGTDIAADVAAGKVPKCNGNVNLTNATLNLTGNASSSFGNLVVDSTQENTLVIPKNSYREFPLNLSGKTIQNNDGTNQIEVKTSGKSADGDVVITYANRHHANPEQYIYKGTDPKLYVQQDANNLVLKKDAKPTAKIVIYKGDENGENYNRLDAYATYKEAFESIGEGEEGATYKFVNVIAADFTPEDQAAFLTLKDAKAAGFVFEGGPRKDEYGHEDSMGITRNGKTEYSYIMRVKETDENINAGKARMTSITMPSGQNVTWNQFVRYNNYTNEKPYFEFLNDGGTLTFGEKFQPLRSDNALWECIVYGGAVTEANNSKAVTINIKTGLFREVWGGNKTGIHDGKVNINIDSTIEDSKEGRMYIRYLDGASKEESGKAAKSTNKDVTITIKNNATFEGSNKGAGFNNYSYLWNQGEVQIQNIYNYDKLNIKSGTLFIPAVGTYGNANYDEANIIADTYLDKNADADKKANHYEGKTTVYDGATLKLMNPSGKKVMGSLVRQKNADVTRKARVIITRPSGTVSDPSNIYLVNLTGEDPFGVNATGEDAFSGCKLTVSYTNNVDGADKDILFNLTGTTADADHVNLKAVEGDLRRKTMYPSVDDKTIRIEEAYLMLVEPNGNYTKYRDVAGVIAALADKEKIRKVEKPDASSEYKIAFIASGWSINEDYVMNKTSTPHEDELDAMALAAGKTKRVKTVTTKKEVDGKEVTTEEVKEVNLGTFSYWGVQYPDLSETLKDVKVTWTNLLNGENNPKDWRTFYPNGELNFFGKETVVDGFLLRYDGVGVTKEPTDIYANGSNLTFTTQNAIDGTPLPSLYGGSTKDPKETGATKGNNITILANVHTHMQFQDLKDFKNLTIGDGKVGRPQVRIKGQLNKNLGDGTVEAEEEGIITNDTKTNGKNIFQKAVEAIQSAIGIQADNDDSTAVAENSGNVYLNLGYLKLEGYQKSYIGNLQIGDVTENAIAIPKDETDNKNLTYPLQIAGKIIYDNKEVEAEDYTGVINKRLWIAPVNAGGGVLGRYGDVLVQFEDAANAIKTQYRSGHNSFYIETDDKSVLFWANKNTPIKKIELTKYKTNSDGQLEQQGDAQTYRTYAEAFQAVGEGDINTTYQFKNLTEADFYQEDADALAYYYYENADGKLMKKQRQAKDFVFVSGEYNATYGTDYHQAYGDFNNANYYSVIFRIPRVTMPGNHSVTWNTLMINLRAGKFEFINNGNILTFDERFRYWDSVSNVIVYGGAEASNCTKDVTLNIKAGQFDEIYGGNKYYYKDNDSTQMHVKHTGKVNINIDVPTNRMSANTNYLLIKRLDGASAQIGAPNMTGNKELVERVIQASKDGVALSTDEVTVKGVKGLVFPDVSREADAKTGTATITVRNPIGKNANNEDVPYKYSGELYGYSQGIRIEQLYNYDEFNIESGVVSFPWNNRHDDNLIASALKGYTGKTVIGDGATLNLLNAWGYRRMGSLVRKDGADVTTAANLYFYKTGTYASMDADNKKNPFVVDLTSEYPFGEGDAKGSKIRVKGNFDNDNGLVFKLTNPEIEKNQDRVSIKTLESGFNTTNLVAKPEEATIRLENAYVMLVDPQNNITKYRDTAGAIAALAEKERQRKTELEAEAGKPDAEKNPELQKSDYVIGYFRKENYQMNAKITVDGKKERRAKADELEAMALAAGKTSMPGKDDLGTFTYLDQTYPNLADDVKNAKITWTGRRNNDNGVRAENDTPWIEFYVGNDLNFFGTDSTVEGLILNFNKYDNIEVVSRDIYANGGNLTFTKMCYVREATNDQGARDNTFYPSLYGGSTKDPKVQTEAEKNATKGKNIIIYSPDDRLKFYDVKDFRSLTLGDHGVSSRPYPNIYGQVNRDLGDGSIKYEEETAQTDTNSIATFFKDTVERFSKFIGVQAADEEDGNADPVDPADPDADADKDKDADPEKDDNGNLRGSVYLNSGHLRMMGYCSSYIGDLVGSGQTSDNNWVSIPKDNDDQKNLTYPLHIAGKTINPTDNVATKIRIETQDKDGGSRGGTYGDALIEYADKANSNPEQYTYGHNPGTTNPHVAKDEFVLLFWDTRSEDWIKRIELTKYTTDTDGNLVQQGTAERYRTYAEAFQSIGEGDADITYQFKILISSDFTQEDADKLTYYYYDKTVDGEVKHLKKKRQAKDFVFVSDVVDTTRNSGEYVQAAGDENQSHYTVQFRIKGVTMPDQHSVTWNALMINRRTGNFEFFNNGNKLTFEKDFKYWDNARNVFVYGGAESGTCAEDAEINIKAGNFLGIYGGNKAGTHTGNVAINVDCPADKVTTRNLYFDRIDGAGREKSEPLSTEAIKQSQDQKVDSWTPDQVERDAKDKTAKITVKNGLVKGSTGVVTVRNIFNYDELRIQEGTLTIPNTGNHLENIYASLIQGYKGKTVIGDDAELRIENPWALKRLGSLERQENAKVHKSAKLYFARTGNYNNRFPLTSEEHPFTIWLSDEKPFGDVDKVRGAKINITSYNGDDAENEVVFKLTGVNNDKRQVTVKTLESSLTYMTLYPDKDNAVIRYKKAYIALKDPQGVWTRYRDIAGAVTALADKEATRTAQKESNAKNYEISFFRNGTYFMNQTTTVNGAEVKQAFADERKAMEFAAGKGTGAYTYLDEEYNTLATDVAQAEIDWHGDLDVNGNYRGWNGSYWVHWYAGGDLNFFGTETDLCGMYLNYEDNASLEGPITSRDIYANGSNLTLDKGFIIEPYNSTDKTLYPSIYGGNAKTLADKDPNRPAGDITIRANYDRSAYVKLFDLKDFNSLTIGDNNQTGEHGQGASRGHATIYGQMSYKLDAEDEDTATQKNTVIDKVADFFKGVADKFLEVTGIQEQDADAGQTQQPATWVDKGGELCFNYGWLDLEGYQKSYVGKLKIKDNAGLENRLIIPKDNTNNQQLTYPLQVAGTITHETADILTDETKANRRLYLQETQDERWGDVLIQAKDKTQVTEKAKDYRGTLTVSVDENDVLYWNNDKTIKKIELTKWVEKKTTDQDGNETVTVERLTQKNKDTGDEEEVPAEYYRTYAQAFKAVGEGDDTIIYQFKNTITTNFTAEDQEELLKPRKAKEFKFVSDTYDATRSGDEYNYRAYNTYAVMFRIQTVNLPSSYSVTFDQLIGYEGTGRLEIINNGGTLTFGENFRTRNIGHDPWDVVVYGGAESGNCDKDVTLNLKAGQFDEIYGGNKAGKHTGNVSINVDVPTNKISAEANYLKIRRLDGASAQVDADDAISNKLVGDRLYTAARKSQAALDEVTDDAGKTWKIFPETQREAADKTAKININNPIGKDANGKDVAYTSGMVSIKNIFNYDELKVERGTLKMPDIQYNAHIVASLLKGYAGRTVIGNDAELRLENAWCYRRLGKLVRLKNIEQVKAEAEKEQKEPEEAADVSKSAKLFFNYVGDYAGYNATKEKHPFMITLTDKDPFEADTCMGTKISVTSNGYGAKWVAFYLPGLNTEKDVTVKTLTSGQQSWALIPNDSTDDTVDKRSIIWDTAEVMLIDPSGEKTYYKDMAGAIVALAGKEENRRKSQPNVTDEDYVGGDYTIGFNRWIYHQGNGVYYNTYEVSELDHDAMEYVVGKKTGAFTYLGTEYTNLTFADKANKIRWTGDVDTNGNDTGHWMELRINQNLNFFGKNTVIQGFQLAFRDFTQAAYTEAANKDIYLNGSNLTMEKHTWVSNGGYPNLYGGSKKNPTSKDWDDKTVKKGGNITLYSADQSLLFNEVKDFENLTLENKYGRMNTKFYGPIISDPYSEDGWARRGDVTLIDAHLFMWGKESSSFKNLISDRTTNTGVNRMDIAAGVDTHPLKLSGKLNLKVKDGATVDPFEVEIKDNRVVKEDILVEFKDKANADLAQWKYVNNSYTLAKNKEENCIIIAGEDPIYEITARNGKTGTVQTFGMPGEYLDTVRGNTEWTRLKDEAVTGENKWYDKALLIATDYRTSSRFFTKWFKREQETDQTIVQKTGDPYKVLKTMTSDLNENYNVYRYQTTSNIFPYYAGLNDQFELGYASDGFTLSELDAMWNANPKDNKNRYWYSTITEKTGYTGYIYDKNSTDPNNRIPSWSGMGEGTDFYDYDTGKWVENPKADVDIKLLKSYNWNLITLLHNNNNSEVFNAIKGIDRQSSVMIDFDKYYYYSDGNGNALNGDEGTSLSTMQYWLKNVKFGKSGTASFTGLRNDSDLNQNTTLVLDDARASHTYTRSGDHSLKWVQINNVKNAKVIYDTQAKDRKGLPPFYNIHDVDNVEIDSSNSTLTTGLHVYYVRDNLTFNTGEKGNYAWAWMLGKTYNNSGGHAYQGYDPNRPMHMTLKGDGEIRIRENNGTWAALSADILELQGDPVLAKPENKGKDHYVLWVNHEVASNGHQIQAKLMIVNNGVDDKFNQKEPYTDSTTETILPRWNAANRDNVITENGVRVQKTTQEYQEGNYSLYAISYYDGIYLDATDFRIADEDLTFYTEAGYHITSQKYNDNRNQIVIKQVKDPTTGEVVKDPIKVTSQDGTTAYYPTYKKAFEAIQANKDAKDYTITNLVEWSFTDEDQDALKLITKNNASSLTFESGAREDLDGKAKVDRYRLRMRPQNLELPEGVDVTFQNIVMKYDQGTQTEAKDKDGKITSYEMTFAGNGGTLTFGEGVVFLKHNDEVMTPTVYGGSTTKELHQDSSVLIKADCEAEFAAVYGAGTKAQTGKASVAIYGATVDKLFGAGTGDGTVNGNVTVNVSGGTISSPIYGGGDGADVTGETTVTINHDNLGEAGNFQSIYGGGKDAKVTGSTTVAVTVPNKAGADAFALDTISGSGTDANEALADNVTGDKTVTLTMKELGEAGTLEMKTLAGFTTLNLGDAAKDQTQKDWSVFKVSERFDSNAETDAKATRTGAVNLNRSTLFVNTAKQGHIGSMTVTGLSELYVLKEQSTSPLKVDETLTIDNETRLPINATKDGSTRDNEIGDKILQFKDENHADKNSYVEGTDTLSVGKLEEYILFEEVTGHDVASWVEYPVDDTGALTDKLDQNVNNDTVDKILHFHYDADNKHSVRDGYVIAVPKDVIAKTDNWAEQKLYSQVDEEFCTNNGTFSEAFRQKFGEEPGTNYWKIEFTDKDTTGNGARGVTAKDGKAVAVPVNNNDYVYVAHIVCNGANKVKDVTTFIVDTSAPQQKTEVDQIELDGNTGDYTYTLKVTDPILTETQRPMEDEQNRMTYVEAGISQDEGSVFWAVGDLSGNAEAEAEAAQRTGQKTDIDGTGLNGTGTVTPDGKITLTIPKAKIDAAKADNKHIWVYAKDIENNTVKLLINLNENVINVKVPLKVNVVAVKKPDGGDCELLAPNCYVVNDGNKAVTAEVNGFTEKTPNAALILSEKEKTDTFEANEISLFLSPLSKTNKNSSFVEKNVKLLVTNPLKLGIIEAKPNADRTIGFTFDAAYNVESINVPNTWISYEMSYHFIMNP